MGAPTMPPQGPPPRGKRPALIALIAAGGGALLLLGLVAFVVVQRSSSPSGPVAAEQCVGTRFESGTKQSTVPNTVRVDCDAPEAKGKVVKVTREGKRTAYQGRVSEPDCPEGTDGAARVSIGSDDERYWEACVRNLKGPHPGDPGAGGAWIAKGDCVSSARFGFGGEKPCSASDWYGKVIARVAAENECPSPQTLETMRLRSFGGGSISKPVLCLGRGGGVLGAGDCIQDPSFAFAGLKKADCGTEAAIAKIAARVQTRRECPSTSTHVIEAKEALLPVMCLQKLRDTPLERLDKLTG
ncbi:hypothetical protein [Spirillospora sp. NPDC029432]|uniref:hypothetical protein n=1 Tax=Spirillospora sp. NPDC029432 TaxID=3154599 RepID=UPI003455658E